MKRWGIWVAISLAAIMGTFATIRAIQVDRRVGALEDTARGVSATAAAQKHAIERVGADTLKSLQDAMSGELAATAKKVAKEHRESLETELRQLLKDIEKRRAELDSIEASRERTLAGLPKKVDLDDLSAYYAAKWDSSTYGPIESFETSRGTIGFSKQNFTFAYVPSTRELAWVRIGKDQSSESAELIKAWLAEAVDAKVQQGYSRVYTRTQPSDYGQYTEALYRRGDMYLKTYYQYDRMLESYGRYSHQYRYYLEVGSESRSRAYKLEEYNQKTGS